MTECIILSTKFSARCSTTKTTRNEDETEQNRKVLFFFNFITSNSIHVWKMLSSRTLTCRWTFICMCSRFSHIHKQQRKCVKWKKIKSPFFAYCTEKKKQLISLLQTFNTAPPDNIRTGEDKKLCVQCVFILLCSIIKWLDCYQITHRQVCDLTVLYIFSP